MINPLLTFENLENTKYVINKSEMKIKKKKILKERTSRILISGLNNAPMVGF